MNITDSHCEWMDLLEKIRALLARNIFGSFIAKSAVIPALWFSVVLVAAFVYAVSEGIDQWIAAGFLLIILYTVHRFINFNDYLAKNRPELLRSEQFHLKALPALGEKGREKPAEIVELEPTSPDIPLRKIAPPRKRGK